MEINGPVNLYYSKKSACQYYLFSDIHIPLIGSCPNSVQTLSDYLTVLFQSHSNEKIEFFIENRVRLDGDDEYIETKTPDNSSSNIIHHLFAQLYPKYPNYFQPIDIRYGVRQGVCIQRTIFSLLERITSDFVTNPPSIEQQAAYLMALKQLDFEYDSLIEYYLSGQNLVPLESKTMNCLTQDVLSPPPYEEIYIEDERGAQCSPLSYQLRKLNQNSRQSIYRWLKEEFKGIRKDLRNLILSMNGREWPGYECQQISYRLLFTLFDGYVLARLLEPTGNLKLLYVGGRHVDTYVAFLQRHGQFTFQRFGYPDTDKIIADINKYQKQHPVFREKNLNDLLNDSGFRTYIRSKIPAFQCPKLPSPYRHRMEK